MKFALEVESGCLTEYIEIQLGTFPRLWADIRLIPYHLFTEHKLWLKIRISQQEQGEARKQ